MSVCVVLLIERKSASNNCDCHERNVQIIGANTQKHTVCSSEIQSIECVHLKRSQINWIELHPFDCKRVAKCWTLRVAMKQQNVDKLPNKSNKFAVILQKISGTGFVCLFSLFVFQSRWVTFNTAAKWRLYKTVYFPCNLRCSILYVTCSIGLCWA